MKISLLPAATIVTGAETVPIVQDGTTKKTNVRDAVAGGMSLLRNSAAITGLEKLPVIQEGVSVQAPAADVVGGAMASLPAADAPLGSNELTIIQSGVAKKVTLQSLASSGLLGSAEKIVSVVSAPTLTLPDYKNGSVYVVPLTQNCTITLPSTADLGANDILNITVRINQGNGTFTLTWAAQPGNTIVWDDTPIVAGANKITLFSFVKFGSDTKWIASTVWTQM